MHSPLKVKQYKMTIGYLSHPFKMLTFKAKKKQ